MPVALHEGRDRPRTDPNIGFWGLRHRGCFALIPARATIAASLVVLGATAVSAQPPTGAPAFEVASIKVNKSRDSFKGVQVQRGQFIITNLTLRELIGTAYEIAPPLRKARMTGGPSWMDADRFDIVAKVEGNPTVTQRLVMLRTLLAERFKLAVKAETRDMPVWALVMTRADRKLGPQLRKVPDVDCLALRAASRGLPPPIPANPLAGPPCIMRADPGVITAAAVTMTDLIRVAFPRVVRDRVVIDRTRLLGSYAVNVEWTPEAEPFASAADLPPGLPVPPAPTTSGVSIFTALQEQLGLKLEAARAPVETLVIKRADRPTED
jgi:uncharacterized protein (TIGR03435 family)